MAGTRFCPGCGAPTTPNESGNYKILLENFKYKKEARCKSIVFCPLQLGF